MRKRFDLADMLWAFFLGTLLARSPLVRGLACVAFLGSWWLWLTATRIDKARERRRDGR